MTTKNTILFALITVGLLAMSTALAQWTPPPGTPPACPSTEPGCNLPLNISSEPQMKSGTLGSFTGLLAGSSTDTILRAYNSGGATFTPRVGIGTFTPQNTLHVAGGVRITGGTPGIDKVLTSTNISGDATWKSLSEIIGSLGVSKIFPGTNVTITKPDGTASDGTGEVKINATGGSGGGSNWSVFGSSVYRPSGNVGIGTSSPVTQLHTTGTVRFAGLGSTDSGNNIVTVDNYGNLKYRIANSSWPGGGSSGGVTKIKAGNNVTISPADGTGEVTINATGGTGGMTNPMTTTGDIIYSQGGTPMRLPAGTSGQVLTSQGTGASPIWKSLTITDSGVDKIIAGNNVTISSTGTDGTGDVTINATTQIPSPIVTTRTILGPIAYAGTASVARASCLAGEVLVGGGGRCQNSSGEVQNYANMASNRPEDSDTWIVSCVKTDTSIYARAYAQCLKF